MAGAETPKPMDTDETSAERAQGYASYRVKPGPLAVAGVILFVLTLAAMWAMQALFWSLDRGEARRDVRPHPLRADREEPPAPRLQAEPARELAEYESALGELLGSYAWIDRDGGVVRIPVDRARDLVLERGLPEFPPAEGAR